MVEWLNPTWASYGKAEWHLGPVPHFQIELQLIDGVSEKIYFGY
jgi:hypothetical protein